MSTRRFPHLTVPVERDPFPFTTVGRGGESEEAISPVDDRRAHGERLKYEFEAAVKSSQLARGEDAGSYIAFEGFPGFDLAFLSLESVRQGVQPSLCEVKRQGNAEMAVIFVPHGAKRHLLSRLEKYLEQLDVDRPRHAKLVEGINRIRRATVRDLWAEPDSLFPDESMGRTWWEVWLRRSDKGEAERLTSYANENDLAHGSQTLGFAERTVMLLHASVIELAAALDSIDDIAELRRPQSAATFLTRLPNVEQREWVDDLLRSTVPAGADAPAVCVLDTGVNHAHPLLAHSLSDNDVHVADPGWQKRPLKGHGTEMAGLALYGDLGEVIASTGPVFLNHRLESVKILPDHGQNRPELHAVLTSRAVDQVDIENRDRARAFMLAVTADPVSNKEMKEANWVGRPTSWSAALDALAYGRELKESESEFAYLDRDATRRPRLFVVSAGNIVDPRPGDFLSRCDAEPVENPGQSWNVLTVGAYAGIDSMDEAPPGFEGYSAMSPAGELAPCSRTSVPFEGSDWPIKPDVVANGGNVAVSRSEDRVENASNLALLTTRMRWPGEGYFTESADTSAATAQVAAMAAEIQAAHPDYCPETVKALIVHSAEWTEPMRGHFKHARSKAECVRLYRRYGMGVPSLDRALRSADNALTLILESSLRPYEKRDNGGIGTREMRLHELPWPREELLGLLGEDVRLRVTLCYFVEPNPSSRGWKGRYRYPSFQLRFGVKRADESIIELRKRVNKRDRHDGEALRRRDSEKGWTFGTNSDARNRGSLHTDIWHGSAAELAAREAVVVYPVTGWWRQNHHLDQSDLGVAYSLIVSIEAPEVEVDLWTPVAQQLGIAIPSETEIDL